MMEKWKKVLNNKEAFGALLTNFSKAFECLNHAYDLSLSSLKLLQGYLPNC